MQRLGEGLHGPEAVHDVLRLAEVDLVQRVPYLVFHVLHHSADVGDVGVRLVDGSVLLDLRKVGRANVPFQTVSTENETLERQQNDCKYNTSGFIGNYHRLFPSEN